jgi:hypothetical protein
MNPSTEDILSAAEAIPAEEVIILPNNKNIIMAAEQAQSLSTKSINVVRTITVPQGISALLALNYQSDLVTNARIMAEAASATETIEITTAVRAAKIDKVKVKKGETIGLINGKLVVKAGSPDKAILEALERTEAQDYEIVTLYYGESVTADDAQRVADLIGEQFPDQEIEVVDGGQPHYSYILSVE